MFVTRLDANGYFLWAKRICEYKLVIGNGIAVDGVKQLCDWIFSGTATFGSTSLTSSGNLRLYHKLDAYGNFLGANQAGERVRIVAMALP